MTLAGKDVFTGEAIELEFGEGRILRRKSLSETEIDLGGLPWISPGWIDLQVNGWMGVNYNEKIADAAELESICALLAERGTTRHLPTIITASPEDILRRLKSLTVFRRESPELRRRIPGFHVEGPFISEVDGFRGAHERRWIRDPSQTEFEDWMDAADGLIKIVTLAPERSGSMEFIEFLVSRGVVVSLGHTNADSGIIREAVAAGARMSTHFGNGMAGAVPRHENPLWPQLAADALCPSLIADSHHLPDDFMKSVFLAKGPGRFVLVSDAAPPGGLPPGRAFWGGSEVEVEQSGRVSLAGTPYLAGAGHLLDSDVARFLSAAGCSVTEAVSAVTITPAAMIGMEDFSASLSPGSQGDAVAFRLEPGAGCVSIETVVLDGRSV